jgi:hypothetical protein
LEVNMAKLDPEYDIETTVDLDNIDEKAAKQLEQRAGTNPADEIDVEEVPDPKISPTDAKAKPLPADDNPEPTEEELAAYSESVRKRIEKLTHARHDERREKEQAQRERDEAISFAQQALAAQKALEERTKKLTDQSISASIEKLDAELETTKQKYIEAANAYDTAAMAEQQIKLAELIAAKKQIETQKQEKEVAQPQQQRVQQQPTARPAPDKRAQEWAARNDAWFQKDKAMTAFVFGVHEDLVSRGVDPRTDTELYYKKLDEAVRTRFPEQFPDTATRTPRTSPVAPASRVVNGRKKVTLTATEISLARRLNVTPEQFAAEKLKLQEQR